MNQQVTIPEDVTKITVLAAGKCGKCGTTLGLQGQVKKEDVLPLDVWVKAADDAWTLKTPITRAQHKALSTVLDIIRSINASELDRCDGTPEGHEL